VVSLSTRGWPFGGPGSACRGLARR